MRGVAKINDLIPSYWHRNSSFFKRKLKSGRNNIHGRCPISQELFTMCELAVQIIIFNYSNGRKCFLPLLESQGIGKCHPSADYLLISGNRTQLSIKSVGNSQQLC